MIMGVGVDIVKVKRLKSAVDRWGRRFLERVFTGAEIAACYEKAEPFRSLAVRFAAKEALIKASGGKLSGIAFREIEVANLAGGAPVIKKQGRLALALAESGIENLHLSLSHEEEYGVAMVVAEGEEREAR
ncbi:MAG: holo-ACP synthase [Nitrospiraceae bacterium]|nr:holo-ACP synthase [Nitrospiraceae bacterium]